MHVQIIYTLVSVVIVSLVSLIGVAAILLRRTQLEKILLHLVSFSAGALLGDAFIHLIPEAFEASEPFRISLYVFSGILFSFVVEQFIQWRHCHVVSSKNHPHPFAILNLIGDFVHNTIDGIIIAGSYLASIPIGIYTTLAVVFHEIPQELGDFGVLLYGGFSKAKAVLFNLISAAGAILGAGLTLFLTIQIQGLIVFLVPFAAGNFIYIAMVDLIPEIHRVCGERKLPVQLIGFILGIGLMFVLLVFE